MSSTSGRMRERIELQSPVDGQDSLGGPVRLWVTYATKIAEVIPLSGRELSQDRGQGGVTDYKIVMRTEQRLKSSHRIIYRGLTLEATGVSHGLVWTEATATGKE